MSTAVLVLQTWRCDNCWVRAKHGKGIQSHRDCSSQLDKYCLQSNRAALPRLNLLCDVARLFSTDSSSNCRAAYCTAASMVYLSKKRVVPGLASYGAHKQPATAPKRTTSEPHGRLTTSVKHMHIYEHSCAHRYFHTYVYTNICLISLLTCLFATKKLQLQGCQETQADKAPPEGSKLSAGQHRKTAAEKLDPKNAAERNMNRERETHEKHVGQQFKL